MQCFRSFHTAERTLEAIESLHMMRKGQLKRLGGRDAATPERLEMNLACPAASLPPNLFNCPFSSPGDPPPHAATR